MEQGSCDPVNHYVKCVSGAVGGYRRLRALLPQAAYNDLAVFAECQQQVRVAWSADPSNTVAGQDGLLRPEVAMLRAGLVVSLGGVQHTSNVSVVACV